MQRLQLHASGLSLFGRCGEAFRRRYLDGHVFPPSSYLVVGHGADRAIELDLANKIKTSKLLSPRDVERIAVDVVEREYQKEIDLREEKVSKATSRELAIRRTIDLSLFGHNNLNPHINPKAVQVPWSVRLDGILEARGVEDIAIDFVGTRDVDEWVYGTFSQEPTGVAVRDIKTSGKSPPQDACDTKHFIQMTSYAIGMQVNDGVMPERVQLDYLVTLKKGVDHKQVVGTRNDYDIAAVFNRLENLARHLKAGLFAPAPRDHWSCSAKWCSYYSSCPYVKNAKTIELRVPKPELYAIRPLERMMTEHAGTNTTDDTQAQDSGIDLEDFAETGDGARATRVLCSHGAQSDPTDD